MTLMGKMGIGNKPFQEYWCAKDICRHIPKWAFQYYRGTGKFPRPIKSSIGKMRWKREIVERWIEEYRRGAQGNKMNARKRWKGIDPSIRLFTDNDSEDVLFYPPSPGLVLDLDGVGSHAFMLSPKQFGLARQVRLAQCPDYPRCKQCQSYNFNLKGWLAMGKEIER